MRDGHERWRYRGRLLLWLSPQPCSWIALEDLTEMVLDTMPLPTRCTRVWALIYGRPQDLGGYDA